MEAFKICFLSIAAAICYGILHDQVTARVCIEYFSLGHPMILQIHSPTAFAFEWGILATWWVGCGLGIFLAAAARLGSKPKIAARNLVRPIVKLLLCMAASSLLAGTIGFSLARAHVISLWGWLAVVLPEWKHPRFLADLWAHSASYLVGIVGGFVLCCLTLMKRYRTNVPAATT